MSTTTAPVATGRALLSCKHRVNLDGPAQVGDKVDCERCNGRPRTVKAITPAATETEITAAELVATMPAPAPQQAASQADAQGTEDGSYDTTLASKEHKRLKAWMDGGQQGDRPETSNLDAMNAAHAAGQPRSGRQGKKAQPPRRTVHPRRTEANAIAKASKGRRGPGRKVTDDELTEYIRQVQAANHGTTGNDELEVAYWVEKLAVSRGRWNTAWATVAAAN